jgi:GNAT superfamily N-acetyltransferase
MKIYAFLLFTVFQCYFVQAITVQKVTYQSCGFIEKEYMYVVDGQKVSFCNILSLFSCVYIIYDLYTLPEYRNNGYAKKLLTYVSQSCKHNNLCIIFIQPGPFELFVDSLSSEEYDKQLQNIINLYKKVGFKPSSRIVKFIASFVYYVFQIHEDHSYLMQM